MEVLKEVEDKIKKSLSNDKDPVNAEKNQKRNIFFIAVGIVLIVVLFMLIMKDDNSSLAFEELENQKLKNLTIVDESNTAKTSWVSGAKEELNTIRKNDNEQAATIERLLKEVDSLKKELNSPKKTSINDNYNEGKTFFEKTRVEKVDTNSRLYKNFPLPDEYTQTKKTTRTSNVPPLQKNVIKRYTPMQGTLGSTVIKVVEEEKDEEIKKKEMISAGSITKVKLITGFDAPTLSAAKVAPLPVLMKVIDLSLLPNSFKYNMQECNILGDAFGDLTSERAHIRTHTLSCITDDFQHINLKYEGVVTGEDGKLGLKGEVITKQGAILARTVIAGALEGIGNVLSTAGQTSYISTSGVTTSTTSATSSENLRNAMYGGLGKGGEKLSEFYLSMADQIYPVIEVSGAREFDVINTALVDVKTVEELNKEESKK